MFYLKSKDKNYLFITFLNELGCKTSLSFDIITSRCPFCGSLSFVHKKKGKWVIRCESGCFNDSCFDDFYKRIFFKYSSVEQEKERKTIEPIIEINTKIINNAWKDNHSFLELLLDNNGIDFSRIFDYFPEIFVDIGAIKNQFLICIDKNDPEFLCEKLIDYGLVFNIGDSINPVFRVLESKFQNNKWVIDRSYSLQKKENQDISFLGFKLIRSNKVIAICENELDTLTLLQFGFPAISLSGIKNVYLFANKCRKEVVLDITFIVLIKEKNDIGDLNGHVKFNLNLIGNVSRLNYSNYLPDDCTCLNNLMKDYPKIFKKLLRNMRKVRPIKIDWSDFDFEEEQSIYLPNNETL